MDFARGTRRAFRLRPSRSVCVLRSSPSCPVRFPGETFRRPVVMPFRPAAVTPPPATLQAHRSSGFDSASRRGGPSGFPAVRATMDGGGCCSVGNKLSDASSAVSTNFANCLIFFGQKFNHGRTRMNTNFDAKTRRRGVSMTRISRIGVNAFVFPERILTASPAAFRSAVFWRPTAKCVPRFATHATLPGARSGSPAGHGFCLRTISDARMTDCSLAWSRAWDSHARNNRPRKLPALIWEK